MKKFFAYLNVSLLLVINIGILFGVFCFGGSCKSLNLQEFDIL